MDISFRNNSRLYSFNTQSNKRKNKNEFTSGKSKESSFYKAKDYDFLNSNSYNLSKTLKGNSYNDFSENKQIPNGHSRYEYNGAVFDIYKNDEDYQSQFVHPHDFNRNEFDKQFPNLKPVTNRARTNSSTDSASSINGLIDENIIQGATGDCWLISALYSMSSTEKGKEIIKNSIKVNDDSSVTVTFGGIGVSYTMSASEISRHDTDNYENDEYSNGDNDVLVMELAVEKLWKDIKKGKVTLDTDNEDLQYTGGRSGISSGGLPNQLVYYLTGIDSNEYYNDDLSDLSKDTVYKALQEAYESGNHSLSFGVYDNIHTSTLVDGTEYEIDLGNGGHALAITDIQQDTVTFVNPWDTSTKYTMTWEQFANLGIGYICSADLDNTQIKENIQDMSANDNGSRDYNYNDYSYDYNYDRGRGRGYNDYSIYDNYHYDLDYNDRQDDNDSQDRYYDNTDYDYYGSYTTEILSYIKELIDYLNDLLKTFSK